jgi:hypothetical protein
LSFIQIGKVVGNRQPQAAQACVSGMIPTQVDEHAEAYNTLGAENVDFLLSIASQVNGHETTIDVLPRRDNGLMLDIECGIDPYHTVRWDARNESCGGTQCLVPCLTWQLVKMSGPLVDRSLSGAMFGGNAGCA